MTLVSRERSRRMLYLPEINLPTIPKRIGTDHRKITPQIAEQDENEIKEAVPIPPDIEHILRSAYNFLSISSPEVAFNCWLCPKPVPPFYYGVSTYALPQRSLHKCEHSASLPECGNVTCILLPGTFPVPHAVRPGWEPDHTHQYPFLLSQ